MRQISGIIVACFGGTLGAAVFATSAGRIALWIGHQIHDPNQPCDEFMCFHSLVAWYLAIPVFLLSLPIGAGLGSWLTLMLLGHSRAGVTGIVTTVMLYGAGIASFFAMPIVIDLDSRYHLNERVGIHPWLMVFIVIVGMVPVFAVFGRLLTITAQLIACRH